MAGHGNPNHPVVQMAEGQWHKFAAILLMKMGLDAIEITTADVRALADSGRANIVLDMRNGRCLLRLVSDDEGNRLARKEGGLPS
jgi:hypothetical protein